MTRQKDNDRAVNAVERTIAIFEALVKSDAPLSLGELERETGLFKSVLLRYMLTLEPMRYVVKREDGCYELGPRAFALGCRYERQFDIREHVMPVLAHLTETTGETSAFYIREGDVRVCLLRVESPQALRASVPVGSSLPLDGTSTAQVLTDFATSGVNSWAPEDCVRLSSGVFSGDDPSRQYICSLAAPVARSERSLAGALMIAGPIVRFNPGDAGVQALLSQAAKSLSERLGWLSSGR